MAPSRLLGLPSMQHGESECMTNETKKCASCGQDMPAYDKHPLCAECHTAELDRQDPFRKTQDQYTYRQPETPDEHRRKLKVVK